MAERRKLKAVLLKINGVADPHTRASILRELRDELSDFDPARFNTASQDIWEIFNECARIGAGNTFAEAVALVVGESTEWRAFADLITRDGATSWRSGRGYLLVRLVV